MLSSAFQQAKESLDVKIALDAMGGDHAPEVTVAGAMDAARDFGIGLYLVGKEAMLQEQLARYDTTNLDLTVIPATQEIAMWEHPAEAVRTRPDNSMSVAMRLVKEGRADAFVTCGNTGGALAAALLTLGRLKGIKRPALATPFPHRQGYCLLLDIGANATCKPLYLQQFAIMGSVYAQALLDRPRPRVALVSNGEEAGKGNALVQETFALLEQMPSLYFVGNVEGKEIFAGKADVVVTDGFTGNVLLKTAEAVASMLTDLVKKEAKQRPAAAVGLLLAKPALEAVAARLDYREYGSAVLLGVDGIVMVGHGRSDSLGVRNAIRAAFRAANSNVLKKISNQIKI